jgi:NAD(P)-dependent dehydrogenase (short-subunit alcohol dehydrogenase family)
MSEQTTPVAVVTGANTGIGRATALHLGTNGFRVVATVRSRAKADKLMARVAELNAEVELVEMDVADDASVRRAFDSILAASPVDVLVNNAGIGGNGVVEESASTQYLESFNVNVLGVVRCTQAVLPGMRARHRGTIVNVSSVVGRLAAIAQSPYVASKWALEGLSEELAQEVAPFGIRVAIIEPGITRSSIFGKNVDAPNATGAYDAHYRRMFRFYEVGHLHASPAEEVAHVIHDAIVTESPRLRYLCSWGGTSIVEGRDAMSDEAWMRLAIADDDREYFETFREHFDIDLT